jgi:type II secretory pathway component PulK
MTSVTLFKIPKRRPTPHRTGAVLVAALVCLLVIMAIIGTMLRRTLLDYRRLHTERDLRQTELLLEAGIARAATRLTADPNYRNETWNLPTDAVTNSGEARVTIALSPIAGRQSLNASVTAEYPVRRETSIRRSRTVQLPAQPPRP